MSIRINLDQIFGSSLIDDQHNNSICDSQPVSDSGSNSSFLNRYKLNTTIFDESHVPTPKTNIKTPFSKATSVVSVASQYSNKQPGERLYYQSKNNITRKMLELQKMKHDKAIQQQKQATFRPKINKNSEKIVQNRTKHPKQIKKKPVQIVPTHVRKQQQQINGCTFKPQLIAKSVSGMIRHKEKDKVFQQLFNEHKIKQVKKKLKTQQSNFNQKNKKKLSKTEFQSFINRNNQFINKVQKKNELILTTSNKFDLETGRKMFSPKTNSFKSHKNYFSTKPQKKSQAQNHNQKQIPVKSIFSKNYEQYNQDDPNYYSSNQNNIFNKNRQIQQQNAMSFHKISQARQDQQQQIKQEEHPFKTVKGFQLESDEQNNLQVTVDNNEVKPDIEVRQEEQENHIQSKSSRCNSQENNTVKDQDFQNESPIRDQEQKNSDEGQTHHQGQQSRCHDHQ